jgi:hypothetical protein
LRWISCKIIELIVVRDSNVGKVSTIFGYFYPDSLYSLGYL